MSNYNAALSALSQLTGMIKADQDREVAVAQRAVDREHDIDKLYVISALDRLKTSEAETSKLLGEAQESGLVMKNIADLDDINKTKAGLISAKRSSENIDERIALEKRSQQNIRRGISEYQAGAHAFDALDVDTTGTLSAEELSAYYAGLDRPVIARGDTGGHYVSATGEQVPYQLSDLPPGVTLDGRKFGLSKAFLSGARSKTLGALEQKQLLEKDASRELILAQVGLVTGQTRKVLAEANLSESHADKIDARLAKELLILDNQVTEGQLSNQEKQQMLDNLPARLSDDDELRRLGIDRADLENVLRTITNSMKSAELGALPSKLMQEETIRDLNIAALRETNRQDAIKGDYLRDSLIDEAAQRKLNLDMTREQLEQLEIQKGAVVESVKQAIIKTSMDGLKFEKLRQETETAEWATDQAKMEASVTSMRGIQADTNQRAITVGAGIFSNMSFIDEDGEKLMPLNQLFSLQTTNIDSFQTEFKKYIIDNPKYERIAPELRSLLASKASGEGEETIMDYRFTMKQFSEIKDGYDQYLNFQNTKRGEFYTWWNTQKGVHKKAKEWTDSESWERFIQQDDGLTRVHKNLLLDSHVWRETGMFSDPKALTSMQRIFDQIKTQEISISQLLGRKATQDLLNLDAEKLGDDEFLDMLDNLDLDEY